MCERLRWQLGHPKFLSTKAGDAIMEIKDFIVPSQVVVDFRAEDKDALLHELARQAGHALKLAPEAIATALLKREQLGTTGTGYGIAVPHARLPNVVKPFAMLVRLKKAIDFDAVDGAPVDVICLLLLPENPQGGWLNALACFARALRDVVIVRAVREASNSWEAYKALLGDGRTRHDSGPNTIAAREIAPAAKTIR
jgi:PTS system nitrogen regulatory IIA component